MLLTAVQSLVRLLQPGLNVVLLCLSMTLPSRIFGAFFLLVFAFLHNCLFLIFPFGNSNKNVRPVFQPEWFLEIGNV